MKYTRHIVTQSSGRFFGGCPVYMKCLNFYIFAVFAYNTGLLSVFGQNLENISQALRLLDTRVDNQYDIRGQPRFDKVIFVCFISVMLIVSDWWKYK